MEFSYVLFTVNVSGSTWFEHSYFKRRQLCFVAWVGGRGRWECTRRGGEEKLGKYAVPLKRKRPSVSLTMTRDDEKGRPFYTCNLIFKVLW